MPKDGIEYTRSALASVDVATAVKDYHIESTSVVSVPKDDERARERNSSFVRRLLKSRVACTGVRTGSEGIRVL